MLFSRRSCTNVGYRDWTWRRRRSKPRKMLLCLRYGKHHLICPLHFKTAFKEQAQTKEMITYRLNTLRRWLSGMLNSISVNREPMRFKIRRTTVFPSQNFSISRPAARRRFHIAMSCAFNIWKQSATSNARNKFHLFLTFAQNQVRLNRHNFVLSRILIFLCRIIMRSF